MRTISVKNLKKYYRVYQKEAGFLAAVKSLFNRKYVNIKAVDGISFEIGEGELIGFIGPNGAGKTTTLKVLSGLLYPTSGEISVLGFEPFKRQKEFQKNISLIMGQKNQLWWDLPAIDSFILNKEIYETGQDQFDRIIGKLARMLEVEDILTTPVRKLSLGQRMKCELIASLLHSPKVLFCDEPTIGLDVIAQQNIRNFIREYNREFRATIILTSHNMTDVQSLCKRVIIINEGKIIYDGDLSNIVNKFAPYKVITVDFEKEVDLAKIKNLGQVDDYSPFHAKILVKKSKIAQKSSKLLSEFKIDDLTIEDPPVEDIIRTLFAKDHNKFLNYEQTNSE